nr:paired immunoglobulin-like type 2 receptor beta [Chrysemys picta bellii]
MGLYLLFFAEAAQDPRYQITQPVSLSAPAGGSVTLPCTFIYPDEIEPLRDLRVYWRRGGFHGEFIYNHTEGFTHWDYGDRIVLVGDPRGSQTASIRIDRLRESDTSEYVCHVRVQKNNGEWDQWRSHPGTHLMVTAQDSTTNAPSTVQATTPATATTQWSAGTGAAPVIGGVLAGAVLLAGIIGLAVYRARKRTGTGTPGGWTRTTAPRELPGTRTRHCGKFPGRHRDGSGGRSQTLHQACPVHVCILLSV